MWSPGIRTSSFPSKGSDSASRLPAVGAELRLRRHLRAALAAELGLRLLHGLAALGAELAAGDLGVAVGARREGLRHVGAARLVRLARLLPDLVLRGLGLGRGRL